MIVRSSCRSPTSTSCFGQRRTMQVWWVLISQIGSNYLIYCANSLPQSHHRSSRMCMWDLAATLVNVLHSPKRLKHWVIIVQNHHGESGTLQIWIYRVNYPISLSHFFDVTGCFFELYNTCDWQKDSKKDYSDVAIGTNYGCCLSLNSSQSSISQFLCHISLMSLDVSLSSTTRVTDRKKARKTTQMLPPARIMVVAYLWIHLSLVHVTPQWALRKIRCPRRLLSPISPKGKPLGSHMVGWKYPICLDITPNMVGWNIGGRVHMKSSAREVTHHPSATPVLSSLTLEVSVGSGLSQPPLIFYTRAPLELHIIGDDPGEFKENKNLQGHLACTFHKTPINDAYPPLLSFVEPQLVDPSV